jgi:hypothetical protein
MNADVDYSGTGSILAGHVAPESDLAGEARKVGARTAARITTAAAAGERAVARRVGERNRSRAP